MSIKDGGQAFPHERSFAEHGMTLRDYATIKMMQAWRAIDEVMLPHDIVRLAQADADAMLEARKKA